MNRSEKGTSSIINKFILAALFYKRDVWKILKNADAIIKEQKTDADFDLQVNVLLLFEIMYSVNIT